MARILLIHTGGTLGMTGTPLEPGAYAEALTERLPELEELAELETRIPFNLDSSDVGPEHWSRLAEMIIDERERFDGFVVVHGTDTMAYSASALTFSLAGLDRPVIFTGAQRPLASLRTDARRNLADAVECATHDIPEVSICFDGLLLRGCRTTKANVRDYRAFDSPGCEPLARLGVDIEVADHIRSSHPATLRSGFDDQVVLSYLHPGFDPDHLRRIVEADAPPKGIVVAAYGVGTVPSQQRAISPLVTRAIERGIDVLVATQSSGKVDLGLYENSLPLAEAGAIGAGAMTLESAVTKMMHALATWPDDRDARRRYLETDVAGERD